MEQIKTGDIVSVNYVGKLDNNEVFDSSNDNGVLHFKVGNKEVLQKFDEAVIGMKVGESKSIHIESHDAYGSFDEKKRFDVKKSDFPQDQEISDGMPFYVKDPEGNTMYAYIESINGEDVKINFNHPLAGQNLNFDLTITGINAISEEELYSNSCGCGDDHCNCGDDCNC